jgi:hypothetical protein
MQYPCELIHARSELLCIAKIYNWPSSFCSWQGQRRARVAAVTCSYCSFIYAPWSSNNLYAGGPTFLAPYQLCDTYGWCIFVRLCLLFGIAIVISAGLYLWLRLICIFECQSMYSILLAMWSWCLKKSGVNAEVWSWWTSSWLIGWADSVIFQRKSCWCPPCISSLLINYQLCWLSLVD